MLIVFQTHQLISENSFIHKLWRTVHFRSESHMVDDLCLDIDARGNFCQIDTVFSQFKDSALCDIENRLADFICVLAAERNLFNCIQELVGFSLLVNDKFSVFYRRF